MSTHYNGLWWIGDDLRPHRRPYRSRICSVRASARMHAALNPASTDHEGDAFDMRPRGRNEHRHYCMVCSRNIEPEHLQPNRRHVGELRNLHDRTAIGKGVRAGATPPDFPEKHHRATRPYRPAVPSLSSFTHSPSSTRHTRLSRHGSQVRSNPTSSLPP